MGLRLRAVVLGSVLVACTWSVEALADTSVTLDGDVPATGPDHFFVPFEVPDGTAEIEILHDDKSADNILDWGVNDPAGWRGWGGGNSENAILNAQAASRSYVPGPIAKGTWNVVVGKAKVVASPAVYHIVVTFRTAPTLAAQTVRKPYAAPAALVTGARYYAGDLHVHSRESGDATPTLDDIGTFAKSRGLDFVEISDHNVNTQDDYFADAQSRFPDLLFIPGIEFTTYKGHANAIGATKWVDHKIGQPGITIGAAVDQIAAQGAIFSINHPALDIGDLCIGCAWKHELDPAVLSRVTGVEIETSALSGGGILFQDKAIAFWESYLSKGLHVTGLGGGDDHRAGKETGQFQSALGSPTTLIYANELSAAAIMDAIRKGHVVVKTDGPADPMAELTAGDALPGDTLKQRSAILTAKVTNTKVGDRTVTARWVVNGVPDDPVTVDTEGQVFTRSAQAPATGEDRYRFEVLLGDNKPHLITNHIFLSLDPAGPDPAAQKSSGGCSTSRSDSSSVPAVWLLAIGGALILSRRRSRSV